MLGGWGDLCINSHLCGATCTGTTCTLVGATCTPANTVSINGLTLATLLPLTRLREGGVWHLVASWKLHTVGEIAAGTNVDCRYPLKISQSGGGFCPRPLSDGRFKGCIHRHCIYGSTSEVDPKNHSAVR